MSLAEGETAQTQLKITPNDDVVPGVWEVFYVEIFWKDYEDNYVDDISRNFAVTVDPIEQP